MNFAGNNSVEKGFRVWGKVSQESAQIAVSGGMFTYW